MDGNTGIFNIWDGNTGETQLRRHKIKGMETQTGETQLRRYKIKWMETQASLIYGMETQVKHN